MARNAPSPPSPQVLLVPGWTGSGPGHWQSLWHAQRPAWARLEQRDWDDPHPADWDAALAAAVATAAKPLVLVAHSLGCVLSARHLVGRRPAGVIATLLVAPCDVEAPGAATPLTRFAPVPLAPLGVPALVVASDDDPFATLARSRTFAERWGAELRVVPRAGHLATADGYGAWPEGLAWLDERLAAWAGGA